MSAPGIDPDPGSPTPMPTQPVVAASNPITIVVEEIFQYTLSPVEIEMALARWKSAESNPDEPHASAAIPTPAAIHHALNDDPDMTLTGLLHRSITVCGCRWAWARRGRRAGQCHRND
eukprot:m.226376 g.226376  ORF g.226376 m.226376 type:complete len:118 (-) comp25928_c2_seq1:2404-2757(-)